MYREILFRAKSKRTNKWIEGNLLYVNIEDKYYIISFNTNIYNDNNSNNIKELDAEEVIPETICQSIGLMDKKGNKIFEGDIFKNFISTEFNIERIGIIEFYFFGAILKYNDGLFAFINNKICENSFKIIGNRFDNPELLD